jgi:hypothetical protein
VTLGAQLVRIKAQCILLQDKFRMSRKNIRWGVGLLNMPNGMPGPLAPLFLDQCESFVTEARINSLPRLVLQASLCHARIASLAGSDFLRSEDEKALHYRETAQALLEEGIVICAPLKDMEDLRASAREMLVFFRPRYEKVTPDEVAAIKLAMLSAPRGLSTHSGHWYNCENGHPVSLALSSLLFQFQ